MASREEFVGVLAHMKDAPFFGLYVKTLASRRDTVVRQLLAAPSTEVERLRGEAASYEWILNQIEQNLPHIGKNR